MVCILCYNTGASVSIPSWSIISYKSYNINCFESIMSQRIAHLMWVAVCWGGQANSHNTGRKCCNSVVIKIGNPMLCIPLLQDYCIKTASSGSDSCPALPSSPSSSPPSAGYILPFLHFTVVLPPIQQHWELHQKNFHLTTWIHLWVKNLLPNP